MRKFENTEISSAILNAYHEKLSKSIVSDVIIVGAGPAGMVAACGLARRDLRVTVLERKLAPGGGIWGGGMAMNEIVVQDEALPLIDEAGIRHRQVRGDLHTVDAVELAAALCLKALHSGAVFLNLMTVEDLCVHGGRVTGAVVNRTMISGALHVDPIMFSAKAVIDATGHDAALVGFLRKRGLLEGTKIDGVTGEGLMDAEAGEKFVVENVQEVYPGLWIAGMSVSATLGGPRMGPIFGGMLLSGRRVAEQVASSLK